MRPTNICHPNERRAPAPRVFPVRFRDLHRVGAASSLGSLQLDRGTGRFTTPATASADRADFHDSSESSRIGTFVLSDVSVGVLFPLCPLRPSL